MGRIRKRSIIPPARHAQLQKENAVYEIRCAISGCPCGKPEEGCGRGFFSLFIQAIYGIEFAKRLQMPYYINFGNCIYPYSDPTNANGPNFWNYYFRQPLPSIDNSDRAVINDIIEVYPLRIWDRSFLRSMFNGVVKHIEFNDEVNAAFRDVFNNFKDQDILGIHIRRTDHHHEIPPVEIEHYIKEIDKRLGKIDKIFLATDDAHIVDLFKRKYGDRVLTNNVIRSESETPVHADMDNKNKHKLGLDALIDCYSLSRCQEAILTHSNLSYAALLLNPELKYTLMEKFQARVDRLKTLILYDLNRWGVRKW